MNWHMSPFEHDIRSDGYVPYRFVMPHIAISGDKDVTVDFDRDRKQWHAIQTNGENVWEVWADDKVGAVLALIAKRVGLIATFHDDDGNEKDTA